MVKLWHKADPSFSVPKAVLYLHLSLTGEGCVSEVQQRGWVSGLGGRGHMVQGARGSALTASQPVL